MGDDALAEQLARRLEENAQQLAALTGQREEIVAASRDANGDDEHDPEGATIAFERQQVAALVEQLQRTRSDIERALRLHATGGYGRCERCGEPIAAERLAARPTARTCIGCAARR